MCAIFEFSDFAQKRWKKIRFKFEIFLVQKSPLEEAFFREWKILVQKYPLGEAFFLRKENFSSKIPSRRDLLSKKNNQDFAIKEICEISKLIVVLGYVKKHEEGEAFYFKKFRIFCSKRPARRGIFFKQFRSSSPLKIPHGVLR